MVFYSILFLGKDLKHRFLEKISRLLLHIYPVERWKIDIFWKGSETSRFYSTSIFLTVQNLLFFYNTEFTNFLGKDLKHRFLKCEDFTPHLS